MPTRFLSVTIRAAAVGSACVVLAACGPRAHCKGEHPYQAAETVSPLQNVEDIQVPRSGSALQIPSISEDREYPSYAEMETTDDGSERIRCLDSPPRLPEVTVGGEAEQAPANNAG